MQSIEVTGAAFLPCPHMVGILEASHITHAAPHRPAVRLVALRQLAESPGLHPECLP